MLFCPRFDDSSIPLLETMLPDIVSQFAKLRVVLMLDPDARS